MATITIKIESEQLAREVLTQLGYLPGDDDVPDLISVEGDEEGRPTPKTHLEAINERTEEVEPVDNEIGASLDVFSEEATKERDELYQWCMEVHKSLLAEGRLKATTDQLTGDELLNYLDAMCDHDDEKMREAAKAMVRKEFAGHTLKMWPYLQKLLDDA